MENKLSEGEGKLVVVRLQRMVMQGRKIVRPASFLLVMLVCGILAWKAVRSAVGDA